MEKAVADLMQWCLDETAQVSSNAMSRYGVELEAEEQAAIADAIFVAMGAAFRRAKQERLIAAYFTGRI